MPDQIPCELCGTLFKPGSGYAKYCDDTCKAAAKKRKTREWKRRFPQQTNREPRIRFQRPTEYTTIQWPLLKLSCGWWAKAKRTHPCSSCGHGHKTLHMVKECAEIYRRWEMMEDELNGYRTLKWG